MRHLMVIVVKCLPHLKKIIIQSQIIITIHPLSEQTQNNNTIEKNEIPSAILTTPSDPSLTLGGLYSNDKDESNRQEQLLICPYCSKFKTTLEREYQRHIVLKHPGKSGYPNMSVIENTAYRL